MEHQSYAEKQEVMEEDVTVELTVVANCEDNRLELVMSGRYSMEDADELVRRMGEGSKKLRPHFDVIADIRKLDLSDEMISKRYSEGLQTIEGYRPRRVVRVVSYKGSGMDTFKKVVDVLGNTVLISYTTSIEKAISLLRE